MRAIMESSFYVIYLVSIIGIGVFLLIKDRNKFLLFSLACIILGFGDAFHLVPRAVGLFTKTLDNPSELLAAYLGVGKLITSITMTIFYLLFYLYIYKRFDLKRNRIIDIIVLVLVIIRIVLCALPQNDWIHNSSSVLWGGIRNIPFMLLGALIIALSFINFKDKKYYKFMWLLITLSFAFYIPVVFFASTFSWVGMLMLPKTICYLLIGIIGILDYKDSIKHGSD